MPAGPVNTMADVFADPQIRHRGMQIAPGGVPGVRTPIRFSDSVLNLDRPSPRLGEHGAAEIEWRSAPQSTSPQRRTS